MQNGTMKLKDLFNGDRIFNIPKYQRAYAWKVDDNLEPFLDDLIHQRGEKSYFLGTFLFHQKDTRGEYEIIDVVDGQQRLTTIIIFIKIMIELLTTQNSKKISKKTFSRYIYDGENYKLEQENEDSGFLHNYIFENKKLLNYETTSQRRLIEAKTFFEKHLSKLDINEQEHIFDILVNSDVIVYIVDKISDATQIFELLNDRGRKLTKLEGVKSFLMYRIGCLKLKDNGEQSTNLIQDSFASIYREVEKFNINENDVLRYHTIAFEKSKSDDYNSADKFIKDKINLLFEKETDDNKIKNEILNYTKRLGNSFKIFAEIKNNNIKCSKYNDLLMIGRVNPFYPLMLKVYAQEQEEFSNFIETLVRFTFRASLISLRSNGETDFYKWIRNDEFISSDINIPIDNNWWNLNKRVEEVLEYKDFYNWVSKNITKYILFSYENYLRKIKGYPLLTKENYFSNDNKEKLNLEHITAQRVKNIKFDDDFKENYLHSLGNLVIDTTSSNSRKNNKNVNEKMGEFIKAPIMSQNEINEDKIDWENIDEIKIFIDKRNNKIIKFIKSEIL